ncbi:hypothetical protein FC756_08415 [Lysinibacillus mangiferihumi]|uniref:Uncharacterized protein n=2 Tax=Lysinibacillus TaxID=400634 RepID=A0A2S0JX16_LYSSH|nr:hypothetical protein LS41612_04630 [Lysinibacillus sphaericus]TKI70192.1 hypothetical protein FC756_08415 [Lysinibacillus mangiferihumi]
MDSDDDFYFLHHYNQKGFKLEYLLNLDYDTKLFMTASLDKELEERNKHMQAGAMKTVSF